MNNAKVFLFPTQFAKLENYNMTKPYRISTPIEIILINGYRCIHAFDLPEIEQHL